MWSTSDVIWWIGSFESGLKLTNFPLARSPARSKTRSIVIWRDRQWSRAKFHTVEAAINYRRTRRFYGRFHVGVCDRSQLYAFNTHRRGTFLAWCNRMMIRYWPLTTHATIRGHSPLCRRLTCRENERGKCTEQKREEEECVYVP